MSGVGRNATALPVVTVILKGAAAPLPTETLGGTAQVAPNGAPEQAKVSVPLNPLPGVAIRLKVAVVPAATEAVVLLPAAGLMVATGTAVPLMVST